MGKEFTKGFFPEPALGAGDGEAAKRRIIHDFIEGVDLEVSSAIASGRMTAAELGLVIVETLFGHGAAAAPAIRT